MLRDICFWLAGALLRLADPGRGLLRAGIVEREGRFYVAYVGERAAFAKLAETVAAWPHREERE